MQFYEWATYLKTNKTPVKASNIENKFELIDSFLAKQQKIIPDKSKINNEDLSEQSWVNSNELMTETLAKVFIKQKKICKGPRGLSNIRLENIQKKIVSLQTELKKLKIYKN